MSERQIITISDDKLSCEATAILLRMLNFPDTDYHTAEELCPERTLRCRLPPMQR